MFPAGNAALAEVFRAKLTAKSDSSGEWRYSWSEVAPNPVGVGFITPNPRRSGTTTDSWAVELNGEEVAVDDEPIVWMKVQSGRGGKIVYDFPAPNLQPDSSDSGPCTFTFVTGYCLVHSSGSGSGAGGANVSCASCSGGVASATFSITMSGVANDGCSDCSFFDDTFTLTHITGCFWSTDSLSVCGVTGGTLSLDYYDPGDGGGTRWIVTGPAVGAGTPGAWELTTPWDCLSTATFTYTSTIFGTSTKGCDWPGTIDVVPGTTAAGPTTRYIEKTSINLATCKVVRRWCEPETESECACDDPEGTGVLLPCCIDDGIVTFPNVLYMHFGNGTGDDFGHSGGGPCSTAAPWAKYSFFGVELIVLFFDADSGTWIGSATDHYDRTVHAYCWCNVSWWEAVAYVPCNDCGIATYDPDTCREHGASETNFDFAASPDGAKLRKAVTCDDNMTPDLGNANTIYGSIGFGADLAGGASGCSNCNYLLQWWVNESPFA